MNPAKNKEYYRRWVNLDITHRCLLQCPACMRAIHPNLHKRGSDISLKNFEKICKTFPKILFCGQMGDAIYHPKFLDILKIAVKNNIRCQISTNGSGKKNKWWDEAFSITKNNDIQWIFGLDGLPKDSHKYRVNQDGESVWEKMKQGAKNGNDILWQYIIFNYNENDIETAKYMARENGITLVLLESARWSFVGKFKPSKHFIEDWR